MSLMIWAALIGAAVNCGIFFTFSNFVMPALARLDRREGMAAMQAINVTVLNPGFFSVFFAPAVLSLIISASALMDGLGENDWRLLVGSAAYLVGCILVTVVGNVPLNEKLKAAHRDQPEGLELWDRYLRVWTMWNHLRTAGCGAAAIAFATAL